ncbi:hypothetical protein CKAH01_09446 [Colletotrichum kahawae]|uniref:Uncharacterized protein n=1 Tax=Colletotrichum kahawae TaxID=34407 RepID=A0AAE0CYR1_COLKA|nr:hypothetical protein CKAH01_09446 [Colletotrichum kahawae]
MTHVFVCGFSPPLQAWPPTEGLPTGHPSLPSRLSAHLHRQPSMKQRRTQSPKVHIVDFLRRDRRRQANAIPSYAYHLTFPRMHYLSFRLREPPRLSSLAVDLINNGRISDAVYQTRTRATTLGYRECIIFQILCQHCPP